MFVFKITFTLNYIAPLEIVLCMNRSNRSNRSPYTYYNPFGIQTHHSHLGLLGYVLTEDILYYILVSLFHRKASRDVIYKGLL